MKSIKYLNAVLTVIAFCLVVITFAITGLIPSATANQPSKNFATVPVNKDGSITVHFANNEIMDVNIDEIGGRSQIGKTIDVRTNQ